MTARHLVPATNSPAAERDRSYPRFDAGAITLRPAGECDSVALAHLSERERVVALVVLGGIPHSAQALGLTACGTLNDWGEKPCELPHGHPGPHAESSWLVHFKFWTPAQFPTAWASTPAPQWWVHMRGERFELPTPVDGPRIVMVSNAGPFTVSIGVYFEVGRVP